MIDFLKRNKFFRALVKVVRERNNEEYLSRVGDKFDICRNVNYNPLIEQQRCLICYLSHGSDGDMRDVKHSNELEKYVIEGWFQNRGFVLDVCHCWDSTIENLLIKNSYDVIFGFGMSFRQACAIWPHAKAIEYFTENPYSYSKEKEEERIKYFKDRHGIEKKLKRTGACYKEGDENLADYIIYMGTDIAFNDISTPKFYLSPSPIKNGRIKSNPKRKELTNFIVFGTSGYIHKGIDILIEVFENHPEWNLYVCGGLKEFYKDFGSKKLPDNIKDEGFVDVQSERFVDLAEKCQFVVSPSCSEATQTGVLTCMCAGLIPIITRESLGMDYMAQDRLCYFFDDYRIDLVEDTIFKVSSLPKEIIDNQSNDVFEKANSIFSLENFSKNFGIIMEEIFNEN